MSDSLVDDRLVIYLLRSTSVVTLFAILAKSFIIGIFVVIIALGYIIIIVVIIVIVTVTNADEMFFGCPRCGLPQF